MNIEESLSLLNRYPLTSACLSDYVRWLVDNPTVDVKDNDLITVLQDGHTESLEQLENLLVRAREILALTEADFRTSFGFTTDLITSDPGKVHDVLAEPIMVVNLSKHGFEKIQKLPRFIKQDGHRIPAADFLGHRAGKKFAIELKTIRMENNPRPQVGKPTGNALIPSWWRIMFHNNVITKIEDKNRRVLSQLSNTKNHLDCDYKMLALYYRRMGPSTLMDLKDYAEELADIKSHYEEIDYIFFKDYFGQVVVYPAFST